jgi:hypothetical protein
VALVDWPDVVTMIDNRALAAKIRQSEDLRVSDDGV